MENVEIVELGPKRLAYVRHVGPYREAGKAWEKLMAWAVPAGVIGQDTEFLSLSYDDPSVTPASDLRYDAAITIPESVEPGDEAQLMAFPGGTYGKYLHKGPYEKLAEVYHSLYNRWLSESGRTPREAPPVEKYLNDPHTTPAEELLTEVYIPVE